MGISQGAIWRPYESSPPTGQTPLKNDVLWTTTSGATSGAFKVVGSATTSNEAYIKSLHISITDPTAASLCKVYFGGTQIAEFPTGTVAFHSMNFGTPGMMCGTTTTFTVTVITSGGTSTVRSICCFERKI